MVLFTKSPAEGRETFGVFPHLDDPLMRLRYLRRLTLLERKGMRVEDRELRAGTGQAAVDNTASFKFLPRCRLESCRLWVLLAPDLAPLPENALTSRRGFRAIAVGGDNRDVQ